MQKVIRTQVQGSGFEHAYIDTVTALEKENGLADLREVAKTAGIGDEELESTIKNGGHLFVPVERYAQSAASSALLESVSFSPEADSIARMKRNAKDLSDAMARAQKEAVRERVAITNAIAHEWFPKAPDHADEKEKLRRDTEREMAVAAITQNPNSPAHGWRTLYNEFAAARDELLRPAMDVLARGMKNGVDIVQNGADGRGIRVSNNEPWYREFYAAHNRAPHKSELMELAYLLTVGDASAPRIEGWMPSSKEEAEAMEGARGQLDELNGYIRTLENIKGRMMQVDATEIRGAAGLSPEAYSVYRQVMAQLKAIGGVQSKAARMNALLFARRADEYARVMREKKGIEDYTARDYFDAFVLRDGGRYTPDGAALHQAMNADVNLDEQVPVLDITAALPRQKMSNKEVLTFLRELAENTDTVTSADGKAVFGLETHMRHITFSSRKKMDVDEYNARQASIRSLPDLLQNAVLIESVPNRKTGKKPKAIAYHRFYVPVSVNGKISTVRIVGEERGDVITFSPTNVHLYDVIIEKRNSRPLQGISPFDGSTRVPVAISIRDMLTGVKDADGNVYARSATSVPSEQKEAVRKQYEGSPQWMMAPNGKPTNLTEDQWLAVRTPSFKAAFGDWEALGAVREIRALSPMPVTLTGKSLDKKAAENVFSSFGEVENKRYGTYAAFPKGMVGKIIKHKGLDVSQMIADIPQLFSSSVLAFVEPEYKKEGHKEHPNIIAYHHYVNKFTANGTTYYIRFSLREEKMKSAQKRSAKRILHSTGISDIRIYEENIKDASSQRIRVIDPGEESKTSFIDYRLADFFDSVNHVPAQKLDENGEPLPSLLSSRHYQEQQRAIYGEFAKEQGKKIITLFAGANPSTMLHEMGHLFLDDLGDLAEIDEASAKDLATVNEWAAWHEGAAKEYKDTPWGDEFRDHEAAILKAEKSGDVLAIKAAKERWQRCAETRRWRLWMADVVGG